MKTIATLFFALIIYSIPFLLAGQPSTAQTQGTAGQIIQTIILATGSAPVPHTVDVIKEGDPETPVKGIVTCMFATMDVLRQAVDKGCNLIIAHEPLYYNHLDDTKEFQRDLVFLEKKKFINDHHLVVWRFHDYIHRIQPDAILSGMIEKLEWKDFVVDGQLNHLTFPKTSLKEFLKRLKATFPKSTFSIVGNPEMNVTNVRLAPGASGSRYHISLLEDDKVDLVIAGEAQQWETYEYVRDAVSQGRNKAVIFLGHIPSEESGMKFCATWLKKSIKDTPIFFIECNPSYWSY